MGLFTEPKGTVHYVSLLIVVKAHQMDPAGSIAGFGPGRIELSGTRSPMKSTATYHCPSFPHGPARFAGWRMAEARQGGWLVRRIPRFASNPRGGDELDSKGRPLARRAPVGGHRGGPKKIAAPGGVPGAAFRE